MDRIKLSEANKLLEKLKENFSTMKEANESMIRGMEKLMESLAFDHDKVIYLHEQLKVRKSMQERIDQGMDKLKDISVLCSDEAIELRRPMPSYSINFKAIREIVSLRNNSLGLKRIWNTFGS